MGLDRRYGVNLRAAAADVLLRRGGWDEADALVEEGRALDPAGEGSLYLVIVRIRLATARGRFTEALAALEVGERMAEGDVDFDLAAYLHTAAAELRCWEGRPDLAAGAVTRGLAALEGSEDVFLVAPLLALACRAAADRVDAARAWGDDDALAAARAEAGRLAALLDALAGRGPGGRQPTTLGFATTTAWARAEQRRAEGHRDPQAWLALARAWTDLGAPAAAAYARWRRAEAILGERTDRAATVDDLRAAAAAAAALGALPLADAVAALARRARVDLAPAAEAASAEMVPASSPAPAAGDGRGPDAGRRRLAEMGLSAREIQVLELVAAGRSNGEIAEVLFIARKTVSVHVSHILARLEVPSRVAAAALALRLGLVDVPADADVTGATAAEAAARTFMFTDIVGSTALVEAIGDAAWADLRAWHDAALRRLFAAHGGIEVDHAGDGFFVAFASAAPAVDCAVAIQRALAGHRRTAGFAPTVRIGIHHGEATRTATGWAGREVHLAARLAARAGASEILASAGTLVSAGLRPTGAQPVSLPGLAGTVAVAPVPWR